MIPHSGLHTIERWRNKVDAMVTGRVAPIILLAVWVSSLGFAGRSNARRALDSNPLMLGANPHPLKYAAPQLRETGAGIKMTERW